MSRLRSGFSTIGWSARSKAKVFRQSRVSARTAVQNSATRSIAQKHDLRPRLRNGLPVERQPPCPQATTILASFQAAEVGVLFGFLG
jgi:hypothetical protein